MDDSSPQEFKIRWRIFMGNDREEYLKDLEQLTKYAMEYIFSPISEDEIQTDLTNPTFRVAAKSGLEELRDKLERAHQDLRQLQKLLRKSQTQIKRKDNSIKSWKSKALQARQNCNWFQTELKRFQEKYLKHMEILKAYRLQARHRYDNSPKHRSFRKEEELMTQEWKDIGKTMDYEMWE